MNRDLNEISRDWSPGRSATTDAGASRGLTKDEAEAYEEVLEREFGTTLVPAPPAPEATGEMSREAFCEALRVVYDDDGYHAETITARAQILAHDAALRKRADTTGELWLCNGCGEIQTRPPEGGGHFTPPDDHCGPVVRLAEGIAALRVSREAERQRAEMCVDMHRWECIDGAARLMTAFRERDTARLALSEAHTSLAAANARVEEAERTVEAFQAAALLGQDSDGITPEMVEHEITAIRAAVDTERAARLRAEGERDAYKQDRDLTAHRLAAAKAEVNSVGAAWREEDRRNCQILGKALGYPEQPGGGDVVVGPNTIGSLCDEAAERIAALRARVKRLEETATKVLEMVDIWKQCADGSNGRRIVAACDEMREVIDAPAAGGGR